MRSSQLVGQPLPDEAAFMDILITIAVKLAVSLVMICVDDVCKFALFIHTMMIHLYSYHYYHWNIIVSKSNVEQLVNSITNRLSDQHISATEVPWVV